MVPMLYSQGCATITTNSRILVILSKPQAVAPNALRNTGLLPGLAQTPLFWERPGCPWEEFLCGRSRAKCKHSTDTVSHLVKQSCVLSGKGAHRMKPAQAQVFS